MSHDDPSIGGRVRRSPGTASPFGRRLRNPSPGVAAAAGVGTHLPGLIYEAATAWVRRHEHSVLVTGSLVLGGYLVVKGTANLLT